MSLDMDSDLSVSFWKDMKLPGAVHSVSGTAIAISYLMLPICSCSADAQQLYHQQHGTERSRG